MAVVNDNALKPLETKPDFGWVQWSFVSVSPAMRNLERAIKEVLSSELPILILGEPGTGKRELAFRIHQLSPGCKKRLLEVDCKTLRVEDFAPQNGIENASSSLSDGKTGTVLLHEVGLLNLRCQAELHDLLLRRFQSDEASASKPKIVFTSHSNLGQEVHLRRFREDLYYRISAVCLHVPPLRHRKEDITGLIEGFLSKYAALLRCPKPILSDGALRFLADYGWPGNIPELESATRTIAAIGDEKLALAALKSTHRGGRRPIENVAAVSLKEASRAASRAAEKDLIKKVLSRTHWNRKRAAEELRISYKALLYKLKQMGVHDPNSTSDGEAR